MPGAGRSIYSLAKESGDGVDGVFGFGAIGHGGIVVEAVIIVLAEDLEHQSVATRNEQTSL